jgi:hypothetical protein
MAVYARPEDVAAGVISPGINVFTANVDVSPRFASTYNSAFIFNHDWGFTIEGGLNFYAREAERVDLVKGIQAAFVDINPANINPARTINHQFPLANPINATTNFMPITRSDINLESAAHPAVLSSIIYGALGYCWDICWPILIALGTSYEFGSTNLTLHRWEVWGKLTMSF